MRDARGFYTDLFADTARSETELLNIFENSGTGGAVALHFRYRWTLADGTRKPFEVVDVIEMAADGQRFGRLTILYDTAPLRADWGKVHHR